MNSAEWKGADIKFPRIEDFYREYPYLQEAVRRLCPPSDGPEYDEQRKAYQTLLDTIAQCYYAWSIDKPIYVIRVPRHATGEKEK